MATTQTSTEEGLEASDALRGLLSNLAQNYYEGEGRVEVRFTDKTAHAGTAADGTPYVAVNPETPGEMHGQTGAEALRLLVDTLCHEVEHHNKSEIDGKREFMEEFDDGYAKLAGAAINILEDNHIDHTRTSKFRGLKKVHDWKISDAMADDEWRRPMGDLEPREQALEGFTQLAFAGKVKGLSDADPEVREALADIAPTCEQVKQEDNPARREQMARDVVSRLAEVIPKTPDLPDWLEEMIEEIMDDLESGDFDPAEDAPEDEEFDPAEAEEGEAGEDAESADADAEQEAGEDADGEEAGEEADGEEMADSAGEGETEADAESADADAEDSEGAQMEADGEEAGGEETDGDLADMEGEADTSEEEQGGQVDKSLEDEEDWDQDWDEGEVEGEAKDTLAEQTGEQAEEYEWEMDEDAAPDIDEVDALDDAYERLEREQEKADTDLEQSKRERDERQEDGRWAGPEYDCYEQAGSETVRQYVEESGQAKEVVEFFRSLKTQDRRIKSDNGSEMNDEAVLDLIAGDGSATNRMYLKKQKAETGDRVVGVTMDHSGSMRGVVKEAKAGLGLLATACEEIGDEFVANAFLSHEKRGKENIDIQMITAPDEEFTWEQMDGTWPEYQDPITPGMRHAKEMMDECTAREEVLFVITDGQPMITAEGEFNAPKAIGEAREEVQKLRHNGTKVIGIGIAPGVDAEQMEEMFGEGGFFVAEEDEIAERLIEAYRTQMKVEPGR